MEPIGQSGMKSLTKEEDMQDADGIGKDMPNMEIVVNTSFLKVV